MTVPSVEFTLLKSCRPPRESTSEPDLHGLSAFVLGAEGVQGPVQLTLDLTNPRRIHELNRRFRGVDRTTDVISFRHAPPPALEGDIAINVYQAGVQAIQVGHSTKREIRLLWIHGLLHLLGYTDYERGPRRKMFKRQNELLRRWEKKRP
jgi:probable rRNA maturation factor